MRRTALSPGKPLLPSDSPLRRRGKIRAVSATGLQRAGAVRRTSARRKIARAAQAVLPASNSKTTRRALWARCGGSCEACGLGVTEHGFQAHHRKMRSQGGDNTLANLIAVHPACHRRIHDNPEDSYTLGLLVHGYANPMFVRARLFAEVAA